jgi:hypothetical protein
MAFDRDGRVITTKRDITCGNGCNRNTMILQIYTIIHTLISLIAIFTGIVVVFGMLAGAQLNGWTKWFLITAVATTLTGFFFPFHGFTPAIGLGIISLPFLALTIYARYPNDSEVHGVGSMRSVLSSVSTSICSYWSCSCLKKCQPCTRWLRHRPKRHSNSLSSLFFCFPSCSASPRQSSSAPNRSVRLESERYWEKELTSLDGMFGVSVTCFPFFPATR